MGKKIISFSLYGTDPKYVVGMKRNIQIAPGVYPGWEVVVNGSKESLGLLEATSPGFPYTAITYDTPTGHEGMFWRFLLIHREDAERVIFRDADSRLNRREKAAVDEWIADDTDMHVMRDHVDHANWPILGGMWGIKTTPAIKAILSNPDAFKLKVQKLDDMRFLANYVWPVFMGSMTHHSSVETIHPYAKPFPRHTIHLGFVGEVIENVDGL